MQWQSYNTNPSSTNIYASQQPVKDQQIYSSNRNPNPKMYNSGFHIRNPTNPSYTSNRVVTRRQDFQGNSNSIGLSTTKDSNGRPHQYNQSSFQKKVKPNQSSNISNFC